MENLLNEQQAAEYLGLKPRTLQAWRTRGGGPIYLRISHRCVRYTMADLRAWLDTRRFASTASEPRYSEGKEVRV